MGATEWDSRPRVPRGRIRPVLQVVLAVVHLLALAVGLPSVLLRAGALRRATQDNSRGDALQRAFAADTLWGVSALLWIGSGLWRYLAGTEKSTEYYNRNHFFLAKMTLLAAILLLELWPMVKLARGRNAVRRGASAAAVVTPAIARRIAAVSDVQAALLVLMVFFAAAMARGLGAMPGG
jgi:putative membrane protein